MFLQEIIFSCGCLHCRANIKCAVTRHAWLCMITASLRWHDATVGPLNSTSMTLNSTHCCSFSLKQKRHEVYSFNYFRYSLFCHNKGNNLFMKAILRCALHSSIITPPACFLKNRSTWLFARSKWCQLIFILSEKKHLIYHFFQDKKTDIQCTWIPQYYFAKETHKIWNSILMDVRWDCDLFFYLVSGICRISAVMPPHSSLLLHCLQCSSCFMGFGVESGFLLKAAI